MEIELDKTQMSRGSFHLQASGVFLPGLHLVSGRIGSGKTTLAMGIAGLWEPDSGSVKLDGIDSLMLSLQFPELHITGSTLEAEINSWHLDSGPVLSLAGLRGRGEDDPFSLSRGELKRLHLACVFSREWDLLILDEPFSALDCREKISVCKWITQNNTGITIIFTHEQQHLPRVDYLWEICEGALSYLGSMPDAMKMWTNPPLIVQELHNKGIFPKNLSPEDIMEAACGMRE